MIYTSIILLTVLKIFSLNEWENVSQFLTDFLWRVSSVIVLWLSCWYCHTYRTSQFSPHFTIDWHCSSLYCITIIWSSDHLSSSSVTSNVLLTLIAMIDLACSWKMAWRGGGTFTERSMVSGRMSGCSMVWVSCCHCDHQLSLMSVLPATISLISCSQ